MNYLISDVEASANGSLKTMRTIVAINHGDVANGEDWYFAINQYYTIIACKYKKVGNTYTADVTYELYDMYDFKNDPQKSVGPVTFADMWELHYGGSAKNFKVYGKNTFTLTWTQGQTFGNGVNISDEN